jgi:hypothetical protein
MTTEPDNIVLSHLRPMRTQLDTLNDRVLDLTQRVGNSEVQLASVRSALTASMRGSTAWSAASG